MNRWFGLCTSRKRRWRQPSRKLESLLLTATRVIFDRELGDPRFSLEARMTISEANSMPVVRRSRRGQHLASQGAHAAMGVASPRC